jgi:ubiquinone/menaquinone biosynthesis C-methylase UbiE
MPGGTERKRGLQFQVRALELLRKYAWAGERGRVLYRALALHPDHTVVDVGCGTGAFTRVLARRLDANRGGRIIGVDRDGRLLRAARTLAKEEGFDGQFVSFQEGDAKKLPFPDNYADTVVCQALLWLMREDERKQVVMEMIRVCKKGGVVGAAEAAIDTAVFYQPGRDRLSELWARQSEAQREGYRVLYGYDRNIGFKLPTIFRELGLERVRLDGVADVRLSSDDRIPMEHKLDEGRYSGLMNRALLAKVGRAGSESQRKAMVEETEPALTAGGMGWEEIYELARLYDGYAESSLKSSDAIAKDTTVYAHVTFIATGVKPRGRKKGMPNTVVYP